jgi:adenylate kinase
MIGIVRERLLQPDAMNGFVLDGFPRTTAQAEALDAIMAERRNGPLIVMKIAVPQDELVRRLTTRRICGSCGFNADPFESAATNHCKRCGGELIQRTDDSTQAIVLKRLGIFDSETQPLVEYYSARPTFRVIDGAQPPDSVARDLNAWIEDTLRADTVRART